MDIFTYTDNNAIFMRPGCEFLDSSNAGDFKSSVLPILDQKSPAYVLDLQKVSFMDSTGLGSLVSCLRRIEQQEGKLWICNMQTPVRTLFELVRLYKVFEIVDTPQDAVKAIAFQSKKSK